MPLRSSVKQRHRPSKTVKLSPQSPAGLCPWARSSLKTYKSLYPNGPSDVQCWQNQVPDMAFYGESENPFLLDSLLAVSALHLAHLESVSANITGAKKSWLQTALRYQDLALAGLNKALSSISSENCEAVAVSAIFVLLLSIAIPGVCNDDDDDGGGVGGVGEQGMARSPLTDLMGLRKLLQGMELVYAQSEVVLMNGVLKDFFLPMFDPNAVAPRAVMKGVEETAFAEGQKLCPQIIKSLARLRTAISLRTDDTHLSSLQAACSMLSDIISPLTTLSHGPAITWPQRIDASIFSLLEKNDPLSCLLFLHYGVVLHIFSYWWFTRNAGRRLVRALLPYWKGVSGHGNGDGDREWRECVEWAKMVVGVVG
ncbi:uncharacterized protein RAG0_03715 [Rhynchosporium agropyri]|uniref:Uncharacterized protein n=1 Tax=Rhynchosporium agropyri TaxID=914238 RepID=A0A1E1K5N2_9HELO|nr:uncharacterized protein RAG0_03715 [Rhynchosporium agropyri]